MATDTDLEPLQGSLDAEARQVMEALAEPTPDDAVHERQIQGGKIVQYITDAFIRYRLDTAAGPENWSSVQAITPQGVTTQLAVTLPNGVVVQRGGVSGYNTMNGNRPVHDAGVVKSAGTDSFKRAALMFGIGADLRKNTYDEDGAGEQSASSLPPQRNQGPPSRNGQNRNGQNRGGGGGQRRGSGGGGGNYGPPRTGKALFAFIKAQEQKGAQGLLDHVNSAAKDQGQEARMIEWDERWVQWGHRCALDYIDGGGGNSRAHDEDNGPNY